MDCFAFESLSNLFRQFAPTACLLVLVGASFVVPYRAGFVNLGISGQLVASAIVACVVANRSNSFLLAVAAAWLVALALIWTPAWLKHRYGANDVLTTLFITYMVIATSNYLLRPTDSDLMVASSRVPVEAIPSWLIGNLPRIRIFHYLAAGFVVVGLYVYLELSIFGFRTRVLGANARVFRADERWSLTGITLGVQAALVTLAVVFDTYLVRERYTSGTYDQLGFIGIAVGLMALGVHEMFRRLGARRPNDTQVESARWRMHFLRVLALPLAAIFVATVEAGFRCASVALGLPSNGALVVFGFGLIAASFVLRHR